jgi:heme exporter protein B
MNLLREIRVLVKKDFLLDFRNRYAISGLLLYLASMIFIVYIAFIQLDPVVWVTLFWIILLFSAVNAVAKSFMQESDKRLIYYYTLTSPLAFIFSKLIYNTLLLALLGLLGFFFYTIVAGNPLQQQNLFLLTLVLGIFSFAFAFTIMSALSAKAGHNTTLMAVLCLPFIIPVLLLLLKLSQESLLNHVADFPWREVVMLLGLDAVLLLLSLILFPYLWHD